MTNLTLIKKLVNDYVAAKNLGDKKLQIHLKASEYFMITLFRELQNQNEDKIDYKLPSEETYNGYEFKTKEDSVMHIEHSPDDLTFSLVISILDESIQANTGQ
jgi:hypothetical protein